MNRERRPAAKAARRASKRARIRPARLHALRAIVLVACAVVVVLTVLSDATSGQAPTHSLVLLMAGATVVGLRLVSDRTVRGGLVLPLVVGVLVQPVIHALAKLSHDVSIGGVVARPHAGPSDLSMATGQLLIAAAVAVAVTMGERLAAGLVLAFWTCWRLLTTSVPVLPTPRWRQRASLWCPRKRLCVRTALFYRGPPAPSPL